MKTKQKGFAATEDAVWFGLAFIGVVVVAVSACWLILRATLSM